MDAQKIAHKNLREHHARNDRTISLKHPDPKRGYGLVIRALTVLAPEHRMTQMQIAKLIGRPVHKTICSRQQVYFSTHGAWATLSNAKLIEKKNGAWALTKLGEQYASEMHLA